jgi:hypothetical protein
VRIHRLPHGRRGLGHRHDHPLHASHGSYFGDPGPPANIAPGQTAAVNVSGADACEPAQNGQHKLYPALRIGLPGGGSVEATGARFDAICGVSVSRFGVPAGLLARRESASGGRYRAVW